jgi:hypothetical protein
MEIEIIRPLFIQYGIEDVLYLVREYLRKLNRQNQLHPKILIYDVVPNIIDRKSIRFYIEYPIGLSSYESERLFKSTQNHIIYLYKNRALSTRTDKLWLHKNNNYDVFIRCSCRCFCRNIIDKCEYDKFEHNCCYIYVVVRYHYDKRLPEDSINRISMEVGPSGLYGHETGTEYEVVKDRRINSY